MMIDGVVHHMLKYLNDLYIDMANPAMPKRDIPNRPKAEISKCLLNVHVQLGIPDKNVRTQR